MSQMKERLIVLYNDRKVRFLFVGVLNTIVGYGMYALFIFMGLHYYLAQLFSAIVGITHSYLWNKFFTFQSKGKSYSEAVRFVFVYGVSYLLNMVVLYLTIEKFGMNEYVAGAVCLFITTIISYIGHKKISFRQK